MVREGKEHISTTDECHPIEEMCLSDDWSKGKWKGL